MYCEGREAGACRLSLTGPPCENDRQIKQFKPRFRPGYLKLCFSLELPPRVFTHVNKLLPDITRRTGMAGGWGDVVLKRTTRASAELAAFPPSHLHPPYEL